MSYSELPPDPKWSPEVVSYYRYLRTFLGPPDTLTAASGGMAMWYHVAGVEQIQIRDTPIPHTFPFPHKDFVYISVKANLTPKQIAALPQVSASLIYNPKTKILTSGCSSIDACRAYIGRVVPLRENIVSFAAGDPRWQPGNADIHYEVNSRINTIDRTYGTVSQKMRYPKWTDIAQYGVMGVPKWDLPKQLDSPGSPW